MCRGGFRRCSDRWYEGLAKAVVMVSEGVQLSGGSDLDLKREL
jgi:hypothetical protein